MRSGWLSGAMKPQAVCIQPKMFMEKKMGFMAARSRPSLRVLLLPVLYRPSVPPSTAGRPVRQKNGLVFSMQPSYNGENGFGPEKEAPLEVL